MFIILVLIAIVFIFSGVYLQRQLMPIGNSDKKIEIVIPQGTSVKGIGNILKENGLIKSSNFFYYYAKITGKDNLKATTYQLSNNMSIDEILEILEKGNGYNPSAISITFKEGINMREIARLIEISTNNSYDDVILKANDANYINQLKERYWFITNRLDDDGLYYKLEGYLFPDTYTLQDKDVSVEYIFDKMLENMAKHLEPYRNFSYDKLDIHDYLSLASMLEKEGLNDSDRSKMATVFFNRIDKGMSLGSDVTTRYANKLDTYDALTSEQFNFKSPYNTRLTDGSMNGKLPLGPVSSISDGAIKAAFYPVEGNFLYFISNIQTKETFFFDNKNDFDNKKNELQNVNQGF